MRIPPFPRIHPAWNLATVLLFVAMSPMKAATFTEIVAFGDSLTDSGNRAIATNGNSTKYPKEVWVTQLAKMLEVRDFRPSGRDAYSGGTNYAFGGATTGYIANLGNWGGAGKYNLTNQISERYLNPSFNTDGVKVDALHIVRIGGNDLMFASGSKQQISSQWSGLNDIASEVARDTEKQIQALAAAGVKNVMWLNLSDPALIPALQQKAQAAGPFAPMLLAAMTASAQAFNTEMDAGIARLKTAYPNLNIIKLDMAAKFQEMAADPKKFGFKNLTDFGDSDELFFARDRLHPTSHAHRVLAEIAFEALSNPRQASLKP